MELVPKKQLRKASPKIMKYIPAMPKINLVYLMNDMEMWKCCKTKSSNNNNNEHLIQGLI